MAKISNEGARMSNADVARRTALAAADSAVLATFKTAHGAAFSVRERSLLDVWGAFSVAAATATFELMYFAQDDSLVENTSIEPIISRTYTLTAGSSQDSAGAFLSPPQQVAIPGWPLARIKLLSISAGSVDLFAGDR
jgi:hypothetical protein